MKLAGASSTLTAWDSCTNLWRDLRLSLSANSNRHVPTKLLPLFYLLSAHRFTMQHSRAFILLALLACLCHQVASLAIDVRANTQECFFEDLDLGDKMTITFQVRAPFGWAHIKLLWLLDALRAQPCGFRVKCVPLATLVSLTSADGVFDLCRSAMVATWTLTFG